VAHMRITCASDPSLSPTEPGLLQTALPNPLPVNNTAQCAECDPLAPRAVTVACLECEHQLCCQLCSDLFHPFSRLRTRHTRLVIATTTSSQLLSPSPQALFATAMGSGIEGQPPSRTAVIGPLAPGGPMIGVNLLAPWLC
jgi:hypothetical protein